MTTQEIYSVLTQVNKEIDKRDLALKQLAEIVRYAQAAPEAAVREVDWKSLGVMIEKALK